MMLVIDIILFAIGIWMINTGSGIIIKSGNNIASKFMLTGTAASSIFFSIITAMPETFTTLYTIYKSSAKTAFANLVGSNIHNIPLAIAISSFITHLTYERFANRICLIMLISIILASSLLIDGQLSQIEGVVLLACYAFYVFYVIKKGRVNIPSIKLSKSLKKVFATFALGGVILFLGSFFIVDSSLDITTKLGVPSFYMGIMLMSIGPILPEITVSIAAAKKGHGSISLGNLLGDNIFTIFVVLGLTGVLKPFSITIKEFSLSMIPMFIISLTAFLITSKKERHITKIDGLTLLIVYVIIIIVQTVYLI